MFSSDSETTCSVWNNFFRLTFLQCKIYSGYIMHVLQIWREVEWVCKYYHGNFPERHLLDHWIYSLVAASMPCNLVHKLTELYLKSNQVFCSYYCIIKLFKSMVAVRVMNFLLASKLNLTPICSYTSSDHCFNGLSSSFCSWCLSIHLCFAKVN